MCLLSPFSASPSCICLLIDAAWADSKPNSDHTLQSLQLNLAVAQQKRPYIFYLAVAMPPAHHVCVSVFVCVCVCSSGHHLFSHWWFMSAHRQCWWNAPSFFDLTQMFHSVLLASPPASSTLFRSALRLCLLQFCSACCSSALCPLLCLGLTELLPDYTVRQLELLLPSALRRMRNAFFHFSMSVAKTIKLVLWETTSCSMTTVEKWTNISKK